MYSDGASEEVLGRALRELAIPREQVVVATKVFNPMGPGGQRARPVEQAHPPRDRRQPEAAPARLHRPLSDPPLRPIATPIEETLEALDAVVRAGKALYIGASSMFAWQMAKMLQTSDRSSGLARFVTMQNHYNLV